MLPFTYRNYRTIKNNEPGVLVGDIGGTNSNFGIAQTINGELILVSSMHIKSKEITNFSNVVKDILAYLKQTYGITISHACFAAAGIVYTEQRLCKPTNLTLTIDIDDVIRITGLKDVIIVNDFEVVGYGIEKIKSQDIICIQQGIVCHGGNKAILGAGTGLGKAIMRWIEADNTYIAVPSEGGHADFAAQTQEDFNLMSYIKTKEPKIGNISWEHLLSGNGIERIFKFVSQTTGYDDQKTPAPDEIFKDKNLSPAHYKTAELYAQLYARCAKNWALDALALSGIYIAGGIAAHNVDLFKISSFLTAFTQDNRHSDFLSNVPIWVIADYNVSLYGTLEYMRLKGKL